MFIKERPKDGLACFDHLEDVGVDGIILLK
jgi:hypothetical protein